LEISLHGLEEAPLFKDLFDGMHLALE